MEKKILLVDDDEIILDFFGPFLKRMGFSPLTAAKGGEAVEIYREYQPGLVFLDISLPDKDGLEVLKEIKSINPQAKVVMLSGLEDSRTRGKADELGALDYIYKPVTIDVLKKKIAEYSA